MNKTRKRKRTRKRRRRVRKISNKKQYWLFHSYSIYFSINLASTNALLELLDSREVFRCFYSISDGRKDYL